MNNIEEVLKDIQNMDVEKLEKAKKDLDDIIKRINDLKVGGSNNE